MDSSKSQQFELVCKDFTLLVDPKWFGRGSYGKVFRARNPQTKQIYAIKRIQAPEGKKKEIADNEFKTASRMNHPNIVRLYDQVIKKPYTFIIMEMCQHDLSKVINSHLSDIQIFQILLGIANSLRYMKALGITHRDIKPQNILMKDGKVKISDFGTAKTESTLKTNVGTPAYQAPEVSNSQSQNYDARCDIYSVGIILYEMCYCRRPLRVDSWKNLYEDQDNLKKNGLSLPDNPQVNPFFKDIIRNTLVYDFRNRMDISDLYYRLKQYQENQNGRQSSLSNKSGSSTSTQN